MHNLTFLKVCKEWSGESGEGRLCLPRGYVYLPRKLRLLYWDEYPLTFMHFNFRAEILVKLTMENSNLEKLWEGVQPLRSLKKIRLDGSTKLKEIPDLSNAINLEKLNLWGCTSLVTLPSSIRYLNKLRKVSMEGCTKIEALPTDINLGCLDYLNLGGCSRLRRFPRISKNISGLILDGTSIDDEESSYLENIYGLTKLDWNGCSMRSMPLDFRSENLVYLTMRGSKLEMLWDGVQSLGNLVRLDLSGCENLIFFPDLSEATTLDHLELNDCKSLVVLPSSIRSLNKLTRLEMQGCTKLKVLPTDVNLESLKYLDLIGCSNLKSFPRISRNVSELYLNGTAIEEDKDCFFIGNMHGLTELVWSDCSMKYLPSSFCAESLVKFSVPGSKLEKLWEGIQSLGSLRTIDLSGCESLKEIPDLSTATNLEYLDLTDCKSLVMLPSSIRNLKKLVDLKMEGCTGLEVLPNDVNLVSLNQYFNLSGCSRLRSFPQISTSIVYLHLDYTAIEEVPSWIGNISGLSRLTMRGCKKLEKVASNSFKLKSLLEIDFSDCEGVRTFSDDASVVTSNNEGHQPVTEEATFHLGHLTASEKNCASHSFFNPVSCLKFQNCFNLDQDARKLILQSGFKHAVLPGKEVHPYFRDQACGTSLTISLHESSLSLQVLQFKACILVEPPTGYPRNRYACIGVWWYFRGTRNIHNVCIDVNPCNVAHLVVFHFDLCLPKEVNCHPSELDYNDMAFDFESKSQHRIKGCGVRLIIVSPSKDGSCTSSETQYRQQCGESDMENGRSKKRLWMALTSEKPSKLLRGEDTLQTQILCKSSGNSKATQKFNCVRTKHQKDQSKQNTLPDFDSYTIRTKSQVDSRMDLHRRSQFIFYLQLERELLILDEQVSTDRYVGHGYDNRDLEACFDDIMKEERRSARIAREEDEMEAKLIAEEEERERQRKLLRHLCLRYQMVTKEEDCLPPATEPLRCYFPSSTTPLAELETIQSLEIVAPSFLSPAWSMEYSKLKARVDLLERNQSADDIDSLGINNSARELQTLE
ncbi:hypothetical protein Bca4012_079804 [Brassica carinata]